MPKVSEDYREERRRHIIAAAQICFARKGVHKTTMRDIYAEAGLSSGAIYHYFRSKEEIIRAIYMPDYRRNTALIDKLKDRSDTLRALEETLDFFYHILDGLDPGGALKINIQTWGEAQHSAEVMGFLRLSFGDYLVSFVKFIHRAQQRGEVNPELDSKSVALLLLAPYLGLELLKSVDPNVDVWKYVTVLKAMFAGRFWLGEVNSARE